jgi:hypothetical protein
MSGNKDLITMTHILKHWPIQLREMPLTKDRQFYGFLKYLEKSKNGY